MNRSVYFLLGLVIGVLLTSTVAMSLMLIDNEYLGQNDEDLKTESMLKGMNYIINKSDDYKQFDNKILYLGQLVTTSDYYYELFKQNFTGHVIGVRGDNVYVYNNSTDEMRMLDVYWIKEYQQKFTNLRLDGEKGYVPIDYDFDKSDDNDGLNFNVDFSSNNSSAKEWTEKND